MCQRVAFPQVHIGVAGNQGRHLQIPGVQQLHHGPAVEIVQVQDADFAAGGGHVVDHVPGAGLPDGKLVFRHVEGPGQLHEGLHRKGIMLGGYGEFLFPRSLLAVHVQQALVLIHHRPGVGQKIRPLRGQGHALSGTVENGDADFLFQLLHRRRQGGLGHKQPFRCPIEGTCFRDADYIKQLLDGHALPPVSVWVKRFRVSYVRAESGDLFCFLIIY